MVGGMLCKSHKPSIIIIIIMEGVELSMEYGGSGLRGGASTCMLAAQRILHEALHIESSFIE